MALFLISAFFYFPHFVEKERKKQAETHQGLTYFAEPLPYNESQKEGGLCIMNCT